MKPKVIAIAGRAQAGKDTFASFFPTDRGFARIALADNLKTLCQLVFRVSPWHTDTQEGKAMVLDPPVTITNMEFWKVVSYMELTHLTELGEIPDSKIEHLQRQFPIEIKTVRHLLQFVGTEICRTLIPSYHVDVLLRKISGPGSEGLTWLVTDCRFADERSGFQKAADTTLVLIRRPLADAAPVTHASEAGLGNENQYDYVIHNDGTIEDLSYKAAETIADMVAHKLADTVTNNIVGKTTNNSEDTP